jgi:hypothetical protein
MLSDLPAEILYQILGEFDDAQSISNIARCDRRLHEIVQEQGWKTFVRGIHPSRLTSVPAGANFAQVAKGLTLFTQNFDQRTIGCQFLLSRSRIYVSSGSRMFRDPPVVRETRHRRAGTQTMECQPQIDSVEKVLGNQFGLRQEFLAFSTGAGVFLRSKVFDRHMNTLAADNDILVPNDSKHGFYLPQGLHDGPHDVTVLKILSCSNVDFARSDVRILLGRAHGELSILDLRLDSSSRPSSPNESTTARIRVSFNTSSALRSACLSPSSRLAIAVLENGTLEMFENLSDRETAAVDPTSSENVDKDLWQAKFLSESTLAVGSGPSLNPLKIYSVLPTGLSLVRAFSQDSAGSVKAICTVPDASPSPVSNSGTFLSGYNDGTIRLHDLRSPRSYVSIYGDPLDNSQVFSIVTKGLDYIIAGNAERGLLQCFDLRKSVRNRNSLGYSVFVGPALSYGRRGSFPVYSLSSPSNFSPTVYVGTEGTVQQLEFVNPASNFHDSAYNAPPKTPTYWQNWDAGHFNRKLKYFDHNEPNKLKSVLFESQ